eukprot:3294683-Amphidinium_carterae.1
MAKGYTSLQQFIIARHSCTISNMLAGSTLLNDEKIRHQHTQHESRPVRYLVKTAKRFHG